MAFWGIEIKPGKPFKLVPHFTCGRLRISQATLGIGSSNNKSSCVQCNVGNKAPVLLCSLLPDKMESIHLELEFQEAQDVTFSVIGPRTVYLTGYILGKTHQLLPAPDDSESFGEDVGDEDTEVSGDISDDEYEGSFIDDGEPTYSSPSPASSEEEKKVKKDRKSKGTRKRLKKKYELSDSENDEETTSLKNRSRNIVQIVESEDDDQMPISSLRGNAKMDSEVSKRKQDDVSEKKTSDNKYEDGEVPRKNLDTNVGQASGDCQAVDKKVKKKGDDVTVTAEDCHSNDRKSKKRKKVDNVAGQAADDCDPADRKVKRKVDHVAVLATEDSLSNDKKAKKKKVDDVSVLATEKILSNDKKAKKKKKVDDAAVQAADDCQSDDKNIKKKKRKDKTNESLVDREKPSNVGNNSLENGGLVIEELEIGEEDGKIASSERKVTVHYTGRLKEKDQVFDSTIGKTPLKFRLGKDDALDGLHIGIDGMRVGGKRRLIIPPELGYGSKGGNGVPPNAWLVMEVELLKVR